MTADLSIDVTQAQGEVPVTIFHIKGDIDANTFDQLQDRAEQSYAAGTRYLLLDLSEVPYISSAGIRGLHHIFTLLRSDSATANDNAMRQGIRAGTYRSHHLKLLNPTPNVARILSMTGYDLVLEIHSNLQEAIDSFHQHEPSV
jgi:anti-anti-sigma factor